jgi:hypothetical protein
MTPELLNKEFSAKATRQNLENTITNPSFRRKNEVGSRFCGNRQTDKTEPTSTVTLTAQALRDHLLTITVGWVLITSIY